MRLASTVSAVLRVGLQLHAIQLLHGVFLPRSPWHLIHHLIYCQHMACTAPCRSASCTHVIRQWTKRRWSFRWRRQSPSQPCVWSRAPTPPRHMQHPPPAPPPCPAAAPQTALEAAAAFGVPPQLLGTAVLCGQQRGLQQSAAQRPPPRRRMHARDGQRRRPAGCCRRRGSRPVHGSSPRPPACRRCQAPWAVVLKQQQRMAAAHPRCGIAHDQPDNDDMPAEIAYGAVQHRLGATPCHLYHAPLACQPAARHVNAEPASSVSSRGARGAPASKQHGAACSPGDQNH